MRETDRVQAARRELRRELRRLDAAGLSADDAMAERLRVIVRLYEVERSAEGERIAHDGRRDRGRDVPVPEARKP